MSDDTPGTDQPEPLAKMVVWRGVGLWREWDFSTGPGHQLESLSPPPSQWREMRLTGYGGNSR